MLKALPTFKEAANHFVAVGIVRGEERDLLAELRERVAADRSRGQCGFSASWKVYLLKSAASLMASDWLIEL